MTTWVEKVELRIKIIEAQRSAALELAKKFNAQWGNIVKPYNELILNLGTEMDLARRLDKQVADDKSEEWR